MDAAKANYDALGNRARLLNDEMNKLNQRMTLAKKMKGSSGTTANGK